MPIQPPRCRHLHTDGRQCGSPAVRHEKLCYQHLAATTRPSHTPTLPDPEDLHAVQRGLAELLRLTARELIEDRQAKRLFLILTAAGTNLARMDRARRAARELDLRERALTLAQSRLASQPGPTQHPVILSEGEAPVEGPAASTTEPERPTSLENGCPTPQVDGCPAPQVDGCPTPQVDGCPTFAMASSSLRWVPASAPGASAPTTEPPVTDWIDDPLLGPLAPGPDPEPRPEPGPESGCPNPTERGVPHLRHSFTVAKVGPSRPQPEQPSPARQRELDDEAAEQIEFDRRENAWREENNRIRHDNYTILYNLMVPEAQLKEDLRRAQLEADYNRCPLPLGPHPRWGITEQPF